MHGPEPQARVHIGAYRIVWSFYMDDLNAFVSEAREENGFTEFNCSLLQGGCCRCFNIKIGLPEQRQSFQALTYYVAPLSI